MGGEGHSGSSSRGREGWIPESRRGGACTVQSQRGRPREPRPLPESGQTLPLGPGCSLNLTDPGRPAANSLVSPARPDLTPGLGPQPFTAGAGPWGRVAHGGDVAVILSVHRCTREPCQAQAPRSGTSIGRCDGRSLRQSESHSEKRLRHVDVSSRSGRSGPSSTLHCPHLGPWG